MSFTYQETRIMAHAFLAMLPALRTSTHLDAFELDQETLEELAERIGQFLQTDPMRPVESELQGRIANIIEERLEYPMLLDQGDCMTLADRILDNIQMNFQLITKANMAEMLQVIAHAKGEVKRLMNVWTEAAKEGQELEKGDWLDNEQPKE